MKISPMQVTLIDHMGSDLSVVNAARVSFDKESDWEYEDPSYPADSPFNTKGLSEKDAKLVKYLASHKHTSPFNHCFATFRVKAPVFVARQLVKHKFMPWNEVSRRYVQSEPEFYLPDYWRKAAANVKQGSSEEVAYMMVDLHGEDWLVGDVIKDYTRDSLLIYQNALKAGVCPEQARMVLPQNLMTEWIWSGTLGAFADMCRLRLDSHTQAETRQVAEMISAEMSKLYPVSWNALMEVK